MKTTSFIKIFQASRLNRLALMFLLAMFSLLSGFAQGKGGGKLTFKDAKLETGLAGKDGAIYRFPKVDNDLDAKVKIVSRSNSSVYLQDIDMKTSGFDKAWQPVVGYGNGSAPGKVEWWMEFEITFVEKGTNTTKEIEEFNLSAIDIDGNGQLIREYVAFYGLKSYITETTSLLSINKLLELLSGILTQTGVRFDGPTINFNNIDTSGTSVMVTALYEKVPSFKVRVGAVASGANGAAERMYSMYFQEFKYNQPAQATLPVDLKSFDAKMNDAKVELEWSTANEVNFSHFVLQRSTDGKDFTDAAMILSNSHGIDYNYNYSETLRQNAPQVMYYRLKMVDIDGSFKYSQVRLIKTTGSAQVAVTAYPNPVTSELRITIPANWQNKQVVYDVVNIKGNVVKHRVAERASQTETILVNDMQAGIYVIRLKAGEETAVQQVVKK